MLDPARPFVLLDDARPGGRALLYRDPVRIVSAATVDAVPAALDVMQAALDDGRHCAGYLTYDAAGAFGGVTPAARPALPPLWFGVFDTVQPVAGDAVPALLPDPAGAWAGKPRPAIDRATYARAFDRVIEHIRAGDIYQANLTFVADVPVAGDPRALYAAIRPHAAAGHGAILWTGSDWLLSFSPELFFRIDGDRIEVRPMKGTAVRAADPAADATAATTLAADPKQRAENLMIVDLMRNDLARVSVPGSVAVPERFVVETYPSVHQLVSGVTATLAPGRGSIDALRALFPCGSVTGAPKLRAMQVIDAVESAPRGAYTGAIGRLSPDGGADFNVAIRTLHLRDGATSATIGLGSGVVADSSLGEEWRECLTKGRFIARGQRHFDLIETMAFDPGTGVARIERHLERLHASAAAFGFAFDRHAIRNELQAATFRLTGPSRIRLLLSPSGATAIETAALPPAPAEPVDVAIVPLPVAPADFRLRHKTTDRGFYDAARRDAGTFEVAFAGTDGRLHEGSFTSLFVSRDDVLVTPPRALGLLPGVLRGDLLDTGRAVEGELTAADLAQGFYIGNAVRGLIRARLVAGAGRAS